MQKKLNWRKRLPKGLTWETWEHVLLEITADEEDLRPHLEHLLKEAEDVEMLAQTSKEDEELEDAAVADGAAGVKVETLLLLRPGLAHSVITVASMNITHPNVQKPRVHPVAAVLRNLLTSAVILLKPVETELDEEDTAKAMATGEPGFLVSVLSMTQKAMNIL